MTPNSLESLSAKLKKDLKNLPDPWARVDAVNCFLEETRGRSPHISFEWIEKGIEWASSVGYEQALFFLLIHKAYVQLIQGDIKASEYSLEQSRSLFAGEDLWPKEAAYFYHSRGMLEANIGLPGESYASFETAARLAKKVNCLQLLSGALNNMGLQHLDDRNYPEAEKIFLQALAAGNQNEFPLEFTKVCNNLGLMYRERGDYEKALYYLDQGMKKGEDIQHRPLLASIAQEMALLFEARDNRKSATHWYQKSLSYIEDLDHLTKQVISDYARFLLEDEKTEEEGLKLLLEMVEPLKDQGDNPNLLRIYEILLSYYEREEKDKESLTIYRELMELEKEQYRQQYTADLRKIKREMILEQQDHQNELIEAGRKILAPLKKREVFEAFRICMPFIRECDIVVLAEKKPHKQKIRIRYYYSGGAYHKVDKTISAGSKRSFIAYALRKNRDIVVQDLDNEARFFLEQIGFLTEEKEEHRIRSIVCLPYFRNGKNSVLSIQSREKDYFTKARLDFLQGLLTFLATGLDAAEKNRKIARLSTRDSLTNLYNRRQFFKQAELSWASHKRSGSSLGIAILDLDHFKKINDRYGHGSGDSCLVAFSNLLSSILRRKTDIYARYGGEEFIIMMGYSTPSVIREIAEEIRKQTAALRVKRDQLVLAMTVSIGFSIYSPKSKKDMEMVIEEADKALYRAKSAGRNQVIDFQTLSETADKA